MDELAGVSVNEGLEPGAGLVVLDLNDVCKRERTILLGDVLESCRPLVVLAVDVAFGLLNRSIKAQRWLSRRDTSY